MAISMHDGGGRGRLCWHMRRAQLHCLGTDAARTIAHIGDGILGVVCAVPCATRVTWFGVSICKKCILSDVHEMHTGPTPCICMLHLFHCTSQFTRVSRVFHLAKSRGRAVHRTDSEPAITLIPLLGLPRDSESRRTCVLIQAASLLMSSSCDQRARVAARTCKCGELRRRIRSQPSKVGSRQGCLVEGYGDHGVRRSAAGDLLHDPSRMRGCSPAAAARR